MLASVMRTGRVAGATGEGRNGGRRLCGRHRRRGRISRRSWHVCHAAILIHQNIARYLNCSAVGRDFGFPIPHQVITRIEGGGDAMRGSLDRAHAGTGYVSDSDAHSRAHDFACGRSGLIRTAIFGVTAGYGQEERCKIGNGSAEDGGCFFMLGRLMFLINPSFGPTQSCIQRLNIRTTNRCVGPIFHGRFHVAKNSTNTHFKFAAEEAE